ncbi:MAG: hypothetical protein Q8P41_09660 [Pseudomonadota bacterium]|nr:hypothetical protein [Pseudomonadota bacterium]
MGRSASEGAPGATPLPPTPPGGPLPTFARLPTIAGLAVLLALAAWLCRPWLFDTAPLFGERDAAFSAIALAHLQGALLTLGDWTAAPLGWPFDRGTTRADWMFGQAVLMLPAHLAGVDPSRIYELASFAGLVLTAWAGYQLARLLVGPGPHAVLAGLVAGLGPLQLGHVAHVNLVHHEVALVPPMLLALGIAKGRASLAAAGGAAAGLACHFGLYMGLHAALVTGAVVAGLAVTGRGTKRAWAAAAIGLAAALLTVAPVAQLYSGAATEGGVPSEEMVEGSWDLGTTFALNEGSALHAWIGAASPVRLLSSRESPNPGFLVAILAVVGLWARGRPRFDRSGGPWIVVGGVAAVSAALAVGSSPRFLGHELPFPGPHKLLEDLTGGNLRAPVRWLVLTHIAVALYASAGLATLTAKLPRWAALAVTTGVIAFAAFELPIRPGARGAPPSDAYCLLGSVSEPGALYEVFGQRCACNGTSRLRATLFHGRPVVGGNYARYTPGLRSVNQLLNGWPAPGALAFLRATRSLVLEHPPLRAAPPDGATCSVADGHRLCVLAPRAPLPAPAAVTTTPTGPIVGLRWATVPRARAVTLTCPGAAPEVHTVDVWQVLAQVRGVDTFDVFLEAPCAAGVAVAGTSEPGTALYLDPAEADATWLPALPPLGPGVAGMFEGGCPDPTAR